MKADKQGKDPINPSANRLLQACVVYVFFLGLAIGSMGFSFVRYIAGEEVGLMTLFNLATVILAGTLAVMCYRDLKDYLRQNPPRAISQPGPQG